MSELNPCIGAITRFFRFCFVGVLVSGMVAYACHATASTASAQDRGPATSITTLQTILREAVHPMLKRGRFPDRVNELRDLYERLGYSLLWTRAGRPTPQALAVVDSFAEADKKGLNGTDYDAQLLRTWAEKLRSEGNVMPENLAMFDAAVSLNLMRYVSALYFGRINPSRVNFGISVKPMTLDFPKIVELFSKGNESDKELGFYEPRLWQYTKLKEALAVYRSLAKRDDLRRLRITQTVRPGDRHPEIAAMRSLLGALGDLDADAPEPKDPTRYDDRLMSAVTRFQKRHGLEEDGIVGKNTLEQLNMPLSARVKQIQRGLERLRWLPDQFDGAYLIANIPSFQLYGFHSSPDYEKPDLVMKIIVGQAIDKRNTPIFHAEMRYIVFRPYWNIPFSIAVKEILPEIAANPRYIAENDLEVVDTFAGSATIFPPTPDNLGLVYSGRLKLRQRPGPKNALGLAKFIFPNNNDVYLHSTPAQQLFDRSRRDFSHGCIRVEDPVRLAEFVLSKQPEWDRQRILAAMDGTETMRVGLKSPVDVYIFYSTVLVDENEHVLFFRDIYKHDETLQQLLDKGYPFPP